MKQSLFLISVSCILLACGCQDNPQSPYEPATEFVQHTDAIMFGKPATNEPSVVSLTAPYFSPCSQTDAAACRSKSGTPACVMLYNEPTCVPECKSAGEMATGCSSMSTQAGTAYVEEYWNCIDYNGLLVPMKGSNPHFCRNQCNASKTGCDANGTAPFIPCGDAMDEECHKQYSNNHVCVYDGKDGVYCREQCSEGDVMLSCEESDDGDIRIQYGCFKLDNRSIWTLDYDHSRFCTNACKADKSDCTNVSYDYKGRAGTINADSYCTGTLIHPQWVLTAAHCVVDNENGGPSANNRVAKIGIGDTETELRLFDTASENAFFAHPEYSRKEVHHDIALVKLKTPMSAGVATPILPLPKWLALTEADMPVMTETVGFGVDENGDSGTKLKVSHPKIHYCGKFNPGDKGEKCSVGRVTIKGCHPNKNTCREEGSVEEVSGTLEISNGTFYSEIPKGGQCNGDSGGPTFATVGGQRYVIAVTSYGDAPCRTYNVDTAVQDYYDWIIGIAPEVAEQYKEICGNGLDDDGNGLADDVDPVCSCGNGVLDDGEECDGTQFAGGAVQCSDFDQDFTGGTVGCGNDCKVDLKGCIKELAVCGDGRIDGDELCDGSAFANGDDCSEVFEGTYTDGKLKCNNSCTYDTSDCIGDSSAIHQDPPSSSAFCGNGTIDTQNGEVCDVDDSGDIFLDVADSCEKVVGKGSTGTIACSRDCLTIDTSKCSAASASVRPSLCGDDQDCQDAVDSTKSAFDCSSMPKSSSGAPLALILGLVGLGAWSRRRRRS